MFSRAAHACSGLCCHTGRRMCAVPVHPRFAHMVLRAQQLGATELGCMLASLLSERDLFRGSSSSGSNAGSSSCGADLTGRLRVLAGSGEYMLTACEHVGGMCVVMNGMLHAITNPVLGMLAMYQLRNHLCGSVRAMLHQNPLTNAFVSNTVL